MAWGKFLLLRNVTNSENYQLDFDRLVAVLVFHMSVQLYKFVRTVGLPHHFGMLMRCPARGTR
jgi:hypothetical protein